jgi:hypothetical protein
MRTSFCRRLRACSIAAVAGGFLAATPLAAQFGSYPKHNLTFGVGGAQAQGDLKSVLSASPGINIGYGYRFVRYLQADVGLDVVFGAASVKDFLNTGIGYLRIKDREYFVPFGGRVIAPFFDGRFLLSGGGGGAWIRYGEELNQPSNSFRVDCPVCTSRSGWGYYGMANASFFLDRYQHFRVGATVRQVRGHTNGEAIGSVPGFETKDRWLTVFGEVGMSF